MKLKVGLCMRLRDSRCCLVPVVNPAELEVDVRFDKHILPCVKILLNLQQQLFLWMQGNINILAC